MSSALGGLSSANDELYGCVAWYTGSAVVPFSMYPALTIVGRCPTLVFVHGGVFALVTVLLSC